MNRLRALAIRSSRAIGRPVSDARTWVRARFERPVVTLAAVRRRLVLLLTATYGLQFEIIASGSADNTEGAPSRAPDRDAHDSVIVLELPPVIDAEDGRDTAIAMYRLLAFEQAERIARGTGVYAPRADDPVARDLYHIRESAEIDAAIVRAVPGVAPLLALQRHGALAVRSVERTSTARERAVERYITSVLSSDPRFVPDDLGLGSAASPERLGDTQHGEIESDLRREPRSHLPSETAAWAADTAAVLAALGGGYRSRPVVVVWGEAPAARVSDHVPDADADATAPRSQGQMQPNDAGVGSGGGTAAAPGSDAKLQQQMTEGPDESRSPGAGAGSPSNSLAPVDEALDDSADPTSAPNASAAPRGSRPVRDGDAELRVAAAGDQTGVVYPEWDCNANAYRDPGAVIHLATAVEGDPAWAEQVLHQHPALVRRTRREFERLRARRQRLMRQREGEELDIDACVRALADIAAGELSDDRLYMAVRAARRPIAITVLVDVSGSTRELVADGRRVIDVEKTTLLLASEAFDALGDAYSILAFSSVGAADVRIATLKAFADSNDDRVRRRIAAIEPGDNTRLGAAIRHATAVLASQPAGHRLLLIISDGKPNDVDRYFTEYAVEDSRRSVIEARADGVYPFCLTIDASDRDPYLVRVFGESGHSILRQPEQLPGALLGLVQQLLRGGAAR